MPKTYTPQQVQQKLGISRIQTLHWAKLMDLKPTTKTLGPGTPNIYSEENLFCFYLCQRLFKEIGFNLTRAAFIVSRLPAASLMSSEYLYISNDTNTNNLVRVSIQPNDLGVISTTRVYLKDLAALI